MAYLEKLRQLGIQATHLDGDEVRKGLCSDLGFSMDDRMENIRRVSEVNKILLHNGLTVLNSFVSPTNAIRQGAESSIGKNRFILVFVDAPLSLCIERDPKGMYRKNLQSQQNNFTGLGQGFEAPSEFDLRLDTQALSVAHCLELLETTRLGFQAKNG